MKRMLLLIIVVQRQIFTILNVGTGATYAFVDIGAFIDMVGSDILHVCGQCRCSRLYSPGS